ncbi:hypothetical protein V6N12_008645 [Hibiscus sabdariffa]|uniref:Uncharacterized protein n=1 Tax=Hibiscus sabdariffa TaxID=183260 RepID=A0ABR2BJL6_9ROSI
MGFFAWSVDYVLVKWLVNSFQRPWGVASCLAKIDTLACDCIHVLFKFVVLSEVVLTKLHFAASFRVVRDGSTAPLVTLEVLTWMRALKYGFWHWVLGLKGRQRTSLVIVWGDEPSAVPIASVSKVSEDFEASLAPSLPEGDVAAAAGSDASSSAPASTPKTTRNF